MIMLFHRNLIHIFFRRKCNLTFFRFSQIIRHLFTIHIFLQPQINISVLIRIQKIIAFILGIMHAEGILDIFCQRMYLQGQVTAAHGIQKIKTDREFRSVSAVYPLAQKFLWAVECHIHGRSLHRDISKLHVDTVFLRYSIKAPGQIFLLLTNSEILLHPVTAPDAGIKIRLQTERFLHKLPESIPESLACHQLRMILFFRLQHIIKGIVSLFFIAVCQSPFNEKSDLIFRQNRRIPIRQIPVSHACTVAKLNLPSRDIAVDIQVALSNQASSHTYKNRHAIGSFHLFFHSFQLLTVIEIFQLFVAEDAENTVICDIIFKLLQPFFF